MRPILVLGLTACGPSVVETTLAELQARATLDHTGSLIIHGDWPSDDDCPLLPEITATFDGEPGVGYNGGINSGNPEARDSCAQIGATFGLQQADTDTSVIELSDGTATWSFVGWRPFAIRDFVLVSHPDGQLRVGDEVVARLEDPDEGPLVSSRFVRANRSFDNTFLFDQEVTMAGREVRFVMPATPPGDVKLWFEGVPTVSLDRCDAPAGCEIRARAASMIVVTIVP